MATKLGEELTGFDLELQRGKGGVYDKGKVADFMKATDEIIRNLERATNNQISVMTKINEQTGEAHRIVYSLKQAQDLVAKTIQNTTIKAVEDARTLIAGYQGVGNPSNIRTFDARMLETVRDYRGAKAQNLVKTEAYALGGEAYKTPNTANKDSITVRIPVSQAQLSSMSTRDISNFTAGVTPLASSASRAEARSRTQIEKERVDRETEKYLAQEDARNKREAERKFNKEQKALTAKEKWERKQEEKWLKAEMRDEEKQAKEEERNKIKEKKEAETSSRKRLALLSKISGTLIVLLDVTRRILSATFSNAKDVQRQTMEARDLGVTYSKIRDYNYSDVAMGLGEGVTKGALGDIQKMFGNTANIDTKALASLAMVMGNGVGEMVNMGLGSSNPDLVMEHILNAFFNAQQKGVDQFGNNVGQEQARRSLVTLLESVSPDLARIFSRMVEANTYGIYAGRIGTDNAYRDYLRLNTPAMGSLNTFSFGAVSVLGEELDEISAKFNNLASILKNNLALALVNVIDKINNFKWGKSTEEVIESDTEAVELIKKKRESVASSLSQSRQSVVDFYKASGIDVLNYDELKKLKVSDTSSLRFKNASEREAYFKKREAVLALEASNPFLRGMFASIDVREGVLNDIIKQQNSGTPEYKAGAWAEETITNDIVKRLGLEGDYGGYTQTAYKMQELMGNEIYGNKNDILKRTADMRSTTKFKNALKLYKSYLMAVGADNVLSKDALKAVQGKKLYGKNYDFNQLINDDEALAISLMSRIGQEDMKAFDFYYGASESVEGMYKKDADVALTALSKAITENNIPLSDISKIYTTKADASGYSKVVIELVNDGKTITTESFKMTDKNSEKVIYNTDSGDVSTEVNKGNANRGL